MSDPDDKREIVIVRRGGTEEEEGHHGGVWKIAFADFMTALMCFFLVMWLVNAANEQTKASIASYFNPMTLVDSAPSAKGLEDPGESAPSPDESQTPSNPKQTSEADKAGGENTRSQDHAETEMTSDEHLFSDPYAVLAEIAAQTATLQNISAKGDGGAQTSGPATGAQGGESYRDPFAPDFWSQEVAVRDSEELDVFRQPSPSEHDRDGETPEFADEAHEAVEPAVAESLPLDVATLEDTKQPKAGIPAASSESADQLENIEPETVSDAERLAEKIRQEIAEAFGQNSALNQTISVVTRGDGVLISLTDELNYGMFEIGSAVPKGELVLAMEQIGRTLNEHSGKIRINGHTDARPFRNASYDNWRLSSARAHSAYYMLVRAGMDESRIKEVAGFADRELKDPDNPMADINRRIEIFLEAGG